MIKWIVKNKDAIIITVLIGILLEIGKHFYSNLINFFSNIGISFVDSAVDWFYGIVAKYTPWSYSYGFIQFVSVMMLSFSLGFVIAPKFAERKKNKVMAKFEGEDREKKEKLSLELKSSARKIKITLIVMSSILFVATHIFYVIPGMYFSVFDRSMTIIRPYIDENEYNSLKSKWFLMKSKSDYDSIDQRILEIRKRNNLIRK